MKDPKASLRQKASDGPDGAHIECSNCSEAVGRAERRWSCHHPQFRFCLFIELSGLESTSSTCNPVFLPKKRIKQKSESLTLQDPSTKQALVPTLQMNFGTTKARSADSTLHAKSEKRINGSKPRPNGEPTEWR